MQRLIWFTGSSGLDNQEDSVRHEYVAEKGVAAARVAVNVEYSRDGRVSRRKGWKYTDVGSSCHSLFCDGGECLFVTGDALCVLFTDFSYKAIRNVTTGERVRYQQVGSRIYYMNGREKGYVLNGVSYGWDLPAQAYGVKDSTKVWSAPPVGTILAYFNGRMYIVQNYIVWATEPYNLSVVNMTGGYVSFEAPVTMFHPVKDGVWAGTADRVSFLRGTDLTDFRFERKGLFGAVEGTDVGVDCSVISDGRVPGIGVIFTSEKGQYLGTESGELIPLTDRRLVLPRASVGAASIVGKKYVVSLEA